MRRYCAVRVSAPRLVTRRTFGTPSAPSATKTVRKSANIGAVKLDGSTKRWYKGASVVPFGAGGGGWEVLLDDRSILTPKNNSMRIPTESLAYAIAHEWEAQHPYLNPKDYMPLTALAITSVDTTPLGRDNTIADLVKYLPSDPLLDMSDPPQTKLHAKKEKVFRKIHKLFNFHVNVELAVSDRPLLLAEQKQYTMDKVENFLKSLDDWELTGAYDVASFTRSTILGIALQAGFLNAEQALEAARLEEEDQISRSGELADVHEATRVEARVRVGAAASFLSLLRLK